MSRLLRNAAFRLTKERIGGVSVVKAGRRRPRYAYLTRRRAVQEEL